MKWSLASSTPFAATLLAGICAMLCAVRGDAQDTVSVLSGVVVSRENSVPLPFATISVDAATSAIFTDSSGTFRIRGLAVGHHRVHARELGYSALDTTVDVPTGGLAGPLSLALASVPHRLPAVAVHGAQRCRVPGLPDSTISPELATIATELKANAERVHWLVERYPFEYSIEATVAVRVAYQPARDRDEIDTLVFSSSDRHDYQPGHLIDTHFVGRRPIRGYEGPYIYLPELEDVARPTFQTHHCFAFGGVDTVAGRPEIRIDFWPLASMRAADAEGSVYLDPMRYVVLRTTMHLTNGDHLVPPIRNLQATIWYREVVPLVAIEDSASFVQTTGSPLTGGEVKSAESQRVIKYRRLPPISGK